MTRIGPWEWSLGLVLGMTRIGPWEWGPRWNRGWSREWLACHTVAVLVTRVLGYTAQGTCRACLAPQARSIENWGCSVLAATCLTLWEWARRARGCAELGTDGCGGSLCVHGIWLAGKRC
jgi:hypothetical protein